MNLNFNEDPSYQLHRDLIEEMISIYGIPVKFILTDKMTEPGIYSGSRDNVFQSFSSIKPLQGFDIEQAQETLYAYPTAHEEYGNGMAFSFNNFGVINDDTFDLLIAINSLKFLADRDEELVHPSRVISSLIVMPNGKVFEVTNCTMHTEGKNNAFLYSNTPSAYQLSLKSYSFDITNTPDNPIDKIAANVVDGRLEELAAVKDFIEGENSLIVKCNKDTLTETAKIDDVFGLC